MPAPEFTPREFSERYIFRDGKVIRRSSGKPMELQFNPETGYAFYRLTRNDGVRVKVTRELAEDRCCYLGANIIDGKLIPGRYMVVDQPEDGVMFPNYPDYVIDSHSKTVWRICFPTIRRSAIRIKPIDDEGNYRVLNYMGEREIRKFFTYE